MGRAPEGSKADFVFKRIRCLTTELHAGFRSTKKHVSPQAPLSQAPISGARSFENEGVAHPFGGGVVHPKQPGSGSQLSSKKSESNDSECDRGNVVGIYAHNDLFRELEHVST